MTPKISVIVPVYKVEQYLPRCIDSILAQTFTDFELLLIDDGSPDNSGKICDEYAKKDERIRVFHKENGGVSSARNIGLDNARGEWIAFVDSDDWVNETYFSDLQNTKADLSISSYTMMPSLNHVSLTPIESFSFEDFKSIISRNLLNALIKTPWGKLLRRELISKLRFDPALKTGEDTVFMISYYCNCRSIYISDDAVYYYLSPENSLKYSMPIEAAVYHMKSQYDAYLKLGFHNTEFMNSIFTYFFRMCRSEVKLDVLSWTSNAFVAHYFKIIQKNLPYIYRLKYSLFIAYYRMKNKLSVL